MSRIGVGIDQGVPVDIGNAKELASNCVPVCLCVGGAGSSGAGELSSNWPSSLGDPYWLASGGTLCGTQGGVEQRRCILDGIGISGLEVWEGVHANPIAGLSNCDIGTVYPSSPCVDVTNWDAAERCTGKSSTDLLDVADESIWGGSNTVWVIGKRRWGQSV